MFGPAGHGNCGWLVWKEEAHEPGQRRPSPAGQEVLDRLLFELDGDEGLWTVFVRDYLMHLPPRIQRIRLTLTSGDLVGAMDAVLSLRTSSQMVGAERLAGYALTLERSLRGHSSEAESAMPLSALAVTSLRPLRACAEQTAVLLRSHLRSC